MVGVVEGFRWALLSSGAFSFRPTEKGFADIVLVVVTVILGSGWRELRPPKNHI